MKPARDTRERIRQAALRLFTAKGYARTSIADVEQAAGLAPRTGGFYRHFRSKADLAAEIGETALIETPRDLGFDGVLPLGDTRAELILIAKGYRQAAERQALVAGFIHEVRNFPKIRALQERVNRDLLGVLLDWISPKGFAAGKSRFERTALVITIFGGWLLYLSKRSSPALPPELTESFMLDQWADFWAGILGEDVPG